MSSHIEELKNRLRSIQSAESEVDLKMLDGTVIDIFQEGLATQCLADLFAIFERFPDKDGFGVFWAILHGLEASPGYELSLLESVERAPSRFTIMMINRMINVGEIRIGAVDLMPLLERIADRVDIPKTLRDNAAGFVNYQKNKNR